MMTMGRRQHLGLLLAAVFTLTTAQDYQPDYQDYADSYENQDNLYADYAMKQQEKVEGYVLEVATRNFISFKFLKYMGLVM